MSVALCVATRGCGSSLKTIFGRPACSDGLPRVLGGCVTMHVATLKRTHGEKYPYPPPYPYWKKKYGYFAALLDKTVHRFGENTKLIVVEGNLAVGKKEFAKRLAKEFDLKYVAPTSETLCFLEKYYGYDTRGFDKLLPENCSHYDLKRFLSDPHPERGLVGRLQLTWYEEKWYDLAQAMKHILNTGQGVVMVRSAFSDSVFVEVFKRLGYLSPNFIDYYNQYRGNSICEMWKPHMTIYLDAPINVIRQRINERNDPREVNSKVLSDKFLQTVSDVYREQFLPQMKVSGELLEIDWTEKANDLDMEMIAEELELYPMIVEDNDEKKFQDWSRKSEDDYIEMRHLLDDKHLQQGLFIRPAPWDCPEILFSTDDGVMYERRMKDHPVFKYAPGWAPELGHNVLFKIK